MIITPEFLNAIQSQKGGFSKKQLETIGIKWPPYSGWKADVIGKEITNEQVEILLGSKSLFQEETDDTRKEVSIFVQEHCDAMNTKEGSYTVMLSTKGKDFKFSNTFDNTTSFRMIIQGAIDGIKKLNQPCCIKLYVKTAFGMSKIRHSNGAWKDISSQAINADLLVELKDVIINGNHKIDVIISPETVNKMLIGDTPQPTTKNVTISISLNLYNRIMDKCNVNGISITEITTHLLEKWINE